MNIVSVSRRTDIPAFYADWFMRRVREGYVRYLNPYGGQEHRVSLLPEDVHAFVFWSKNYGPLMKYIPELEERGYDFYFHFTITGLPKTFENIVTPVDNAVATFRTLSERYGPKRVQWRFDPIVISSATGPTFYARRFEEIASRLQGATERCYLSFACMYSKVRRNLETLAVNHNITCRDASDSDKTSLTLRIRETADRYGITLYSCCDEALAAGGVRQAQCVDGELLYELFPHRPKQTKINPTRKGCRCVISRDIGAYDTCPHGCIYCYANLNKDLAVKRFRAHDPSSDTLTPTETLTA
ncbi:MAG: hypothetical protein A2060_06730 [Planctomycetes bacterium GWA2_50_13]|nr:MAG: hypothetical protein A2060_06730 [Planctomycetes bacterium GWA2_50_13]OHB92864.1 MAG: hypothetical protein A3E75_05675 [Planctomycetes bacterium RIFCSPHIGHO2_12_FULL_51_37]OHB95684.1 MAG: hypothetical protein A3I59_09665 [Planctomycetes bacterium RIFCSPLOWO2_02_FULL_50_16]OHC05296.1 MAG: hypothetical protein A3G17_08460 [Planctomycetes bacterium RIFCSPLOWO2_12_FULL_50_35]